MAEVKAAKVTDYAKPERASILQKSTALKISSSLDAPEVSTVRRLAKWRPAFMIESNNAPQTEASAYASKLSPLPYHKSTAVTNGAGSVGRSISSEHAAKIKRSKNRHH
jgi:hypothetical protein